MKKKWTKETFIEACNERRQKDPKLIAAMRCNRGAKAYKVRERRAKTAKAEEKKNAKS